MTKAQLVAYIETYIRNSSVESFTNYRLQTALLELANDAASDALGDAANTTALQLLSGADYTYVIVTGSGIFEYSTTGTPNGTTIFAATGGGTWNLIFAGGSGGSTAWNDITGKPSTFPPTVPIAATDVTEDTTHRFATDAEKATWNAKQAALSLTTTGSSGAATLVGATLNIPQYSGGGAETLDDLTDVAGTTAAADGKILKKAGGVWGPADDAGDITFEKLGWFDMVTTYGADPTGVVDCTTLFQEAIDDCIAAGSGVIYFPKGTYLVGGALQDISNSNSQIVVPLVAITDPTITITIKGFQPPPNQFFTDSVLPEGLSVIKSTLTGASGTAACISGQSVNFGGIGLQQNVCLNIENMVFEAPPNPTFTMLNLRYFQGSKIDKVLIHAGSLQLDAVTEPTNSNAYGIKTPEYNHTPGNLISSIDVWGFYFGTRISELTIAQTINGWACIYSVAATGGYHTNIIGVLGTYWCQNGIHALGGGADNIMRLRVGIIQTEHSNGFGAAWQNPVNDIYDPNNLLRGDATWSTVGSGIGETNTLVVNGGSNFKLTQIGNVGLQIVTNLTTNYQARIGTLLWQSYASNNGYMSDNLYFDGSNFKRFAAGSGGLFYFLGTEGQFKFTTSSSAGSTATLTTPIKFNQDGRVGLGGDVSGVPGTYSGGTMLVNGSGVAIGTNGTGTATSALLDLTSTTRGLLLPRMTKAQRDAISSPVAGLAVYQTDNTPGLRVYNGTNWMRYTETAD